MITADNLEEELGKREIRDKLSQIDHPNEYRAENGYTYLDYVLWKMNQNNWTKSFVVRELNKKLGNSEAPT